MTSFLLVNNLVVVFLLRVLCEYGGGGFFVKVESAELLLFAQATLNALSIELVTC